MEALEEFKVQTSGMSAEYTRTSGGVFNFVMKSGSNQYHGSGLYQWHNESFDANTFANNFFGRPRRRDRRDNWAEPRRPSGHPETEDLQRSLVLV